VLSFASYLLPAGVRQLLPPAAPLCNILHTLLDPPQATHTAWTSPFSTPFTIFSTQFFTKEPEEKEVEGADSVPFPHFTSIQKAIAQICSPGRGLGNTSGETNQPKDKDRQALSAGHSRATGSPASTREQSHHPPHTQASRSFSQLLVI
jgi:hypothetical protein